MGHANVLGDSVSVNILQISLFTQVVSDNVICDKKTKLCVKLKKKTKQTLFITSAGRLLDPTVCLIVQLMSDSFKLGSQTRVLKGCT